MAVEAAERPSEPAALVGRRRDRARAAPLRRPRALVEPAARRACQRACVDGRPGLTLPRQRHLAALAHLAHALRHIV